jgi:hypothetical protein
MMDNSKDAVITINLKADSGYEANVETRIDSDQWGDINRVINGTLSFTEQRPDVPDCNVISESEDGGLVSMSSAVAHELLLIRDALEAKDYDEAEALLVGIADPSLSNVNTWQDLERIAGLKSPQDVTTSALSE